MHFHMEEHQILTRNGKKATSVPGHQDDTGKDDVIALDDSEVVTMYRNFRTFTGKYVAHCHNLAHEDHAMMFGWASRSSGRNAMRRVTLIAASLASPLPASRRGASSPASGVAGRGGGPEGLRYQCPMHPSVTVGPARVVHHAAGWPSSRCGTAARMRRAAHPGRPEPSPSTPAFASSRG